MKVKGLYISVCAAVCMVLLLAACRQDAHALMPEHEEASLGLQFSLVAPITRSMGEEYTELCYVVKEGVVAPCEVPLCQPSTRAGDGNTADGGGMADLTVFLVDADDRIVGRQSMSGLSDATTLAMNFMNIARGEYTAYAYANVEGNDWFEMPAEGETSFAAYKDALLKPLSDGVPVVQNERMPLTGKQDITVEGGENSRTIQMLRPVGKLSITVYNERDEAVTVYDPSLGDILPHTGYTFKHDDILPQSASNPYHPVRDSESHAVIPNSYQLICETLLYETNSNAGFQIGMSYKGADYTFQENLSGNLNRVKQEPLLVKLYKAGSSESDGQFLRLEQTADGNYRLGLVTAQELDSQCFWELSSAGKQQRGFTNIHYGVSLNMEDGYGFSSTVETFKYGGTNDYTTIGEGSAQLTYYSTTGEFGLSSNGTYFQFYTYVEENNGGTIRPSTIVVQDVYSDAFIPLTKIYRNQHIRLNIFFR